MNHQIKLSNYTIFVVVNGNWEIAKEAAMSESAAHGLFRQFVQGGFSTRMFRRSWEHLTGNQELPQRGQTLGKLVAESVNKK